VSGGRIALIFAVLVGGWAIVALVTGGFRVQLAGVIVSSRDPVRPAIVAILLMVAAWRLDEPRTSALARRMLGGFSAVQRLIVPVAACALLAAGLVYGGRAAVGADSSGYLSQSVLWLRGDLKIEQPFVALMPWPDADWTFSPLGYRPSTDHVLVPTYAPGFPLLMAAARLISACAPYYIVPVCAALLVVFTATLGRRVFGAATGIAGAVMAAASPVVLQWTVAAPMSDVPAAAFWIAALLAADTGRLTGAAVSGGLTGIAILIRPNLAPLVFFPLLLSAVRDGGHRAMIARGLILTSAVVPFVLFVGLVHNALYGSPLTSGYGDASSIYSWRNLPANLMRYPAWWWHAHGLIGCLFVIGVFRPRPSESRLRAFVLSSFALAVVLCYLFYLPFENWAFLRFMLPALPIALLLSADAVVWLSAGFGPLITVCVLTAVTAVAVMQGVHRARWDGFFTNADADQRFADAGRYIDSVTPPATVVLAMQHSGSVRYYSGRLTLRYDLMDPEWLDRSLVRLEELGFSTYALLEDWEEEVFRKRFSTQQAARLIDAGPLAVRRTPGGELRFFAMKAAAAKPSAGQAWVPRTSRFDCLDVSPRFATLLQTPPLH
jgi:hypothetical protein